MTEAQDVLDLLEHDHREVEGMFASFETSTDPDQRRELVHRMIIELVRHSEAEEQYLYPAIRRVLPEGEKLADSEIEEHAAAERTMNTLDGMAPDHPAFSSQVMQLMVQIRGHIAEEEGVVFPQLRERMSAQDRADLGGKIAAAKQKAPTRPHPHTPDKPPFNKVLAPGTALVDRVRDWLSGRNG